MDRSPLVGGPGRRRQAWLLEVVGVVVVLSLFSLSSVLPYEETSEASMAAPTSEPPPAPPPQPPQRPPVLFNIGEWTSRLSKDIRLVNNKMNCARRVEQFYDDKAQFYSIDGAKMRDNVLQEMSGLLSQHRIAVSAIVQEAERQVLAHRFNKSLRFPYVDVHRLRGDTEAPSAGELAWLAALAEAGNGSSALNLPGPNQFTSINGGTPVAGLPEWQTPYRVIGLKTRPNFGEVPVNTSMSAVHLPLPLYPGLPNIMNGIAWTEKLDQVFVRNLEEHAHLHHQYYGSHLGFLRTFPAHKWRIPRAEPDLFDARVRPWYIAGASLPKDVVILVDSSGSMTGIRREIAKGVVFEILDTLTSNDNFAVLRFSETLTPVGFPSRCKLRKPRLALSCADHEISRECQVARQQQEASQRYLLDHPNYNPTLNASSYLTNEQYSQSIRNVTLDIQDAFLVPATSRNIRYLKTNFSMPTEGIANFTRALMGAFELLQAYNRSQELSSHCNQAIMLITDGSLQDHQELFNRYNYPNSPVRVFSYVIGREVGDVRPTQAMACNNRGFYARVINLGEVRDQVQKYQAVLARPLVLARLHPVSWTHAYGDETYQVLTDWVLETKRRERARIMLNEMAALERDNETKVIIWKTGISEYDEVNIVDQFKNRPVCEDDTTNQSQWLADELDPLGYAELACHWASRRAELLISVVKPVYYNNLTSLVFERVLHKNIWSEQETHVRNAQQLGVAAVDLRLGDLLRASPSHLLGPNGYAILLNHNGFVLHHPDLRALLEDPYDKQSRLLKPFFGSVDLSHIEQASGRNESRRHLEEAKLLRLREAALRRLEGQETVHLKRAVDCRRRPQTGHMTFHYGPLKDTPYSLLLALPTGYGLNRARARLELGPQSMRLLEPSPLELWTVHPEFRYCTRPPMAAGQSPQDAASSNSEALILEILRAAATGSGGEPALFETNPRYLEEPATRGSSKHRRPTCDKDLFESLLFDAAATREHADAYCGLETDCDRAQGWGARQQCLQTPWEMRYKMAGIYGLELSFVATRSGLTRVRVSDLSSRISKLAQVFVERHGKALDEPWYARTVDWNMRHSDEAALISVPFNSYLRLVAKFRQRITQRQPATANSTKGSCEELDELEVEPEAEVEPASGDSSTGELGSPDVAQAPKLLSEQGPVLEADTGEPATPQPPAPPTVDYGNLSTFEILDLIVNSSVHVSSMQTLVANRNKARTPVGVAGLLFDYSAFARRFLNSTSLKISHLDGSAYSSSGPGDQEGSPGPEVEVELCGAGVQCPTACGYRNDTVDCLLVDNNGYVVVAEDLVYIGRPLIDYDDRLMQALIDRRLFFAVHLTDYQAVCVRNETAATTTNQAPSAGAATGSSPATRTSSPLRDWGPTGAALARNLVAIGGWLWLQLASLLTLEPALDQWGLEQHRARSLVEAQAPATGAQQLALLPNKTLLRACEKPVLLYETRPPRESAAATDQPLAGRPDPYLSRCGCPSWFVAEHVPRTNLLMLIVNTSLACRRCDSNLVPGPVAPQVLLADQQQSREEQVCSMLEREQSLYTRKPEACITSHPEESQIHLCGAASSLQPSFTCSRLLPPLLLLLLLFYLTHQSTAVA